MLLAWGGFPFVEDFDLETLPRLLLQGFLSTLRINADSGDSVAVPENDTSSLSSRTFCCIHCSSLCLSQPLISSMVGLFAAGFARPAGELRLGLVLERNSFRFPWRVRLQRTLPGRLERAWS